MKARLPNLFSIKQATDLIRIGRDYDGGYLVSKSDIEKTDELIGLGINDDWSFEEDFLSQKKYLYLHMLKLMKLIKATID